MSQIPSYVRGPSSASLLLVPAVVLAAAVGACSSGHAQGEEGAACYPNDTCNAGLTCSGGTCVASNGEAGGATAGSTGHTSSAGGASGTGGVPGTGGAPGTSGTTTASSSSGSDNAAPMFLSFGTNVMSITVGQMVTFTAVLTDPNGIADLVGGSLMDQNGATYGAFQASGGMGSFQMTVSWAQMNQTQSIDFPYGTNGQRTFTAKFFDMNGKSAQMSTTITLTCNGLQAVAGACYDTMNDPSNCGTVGHTCPPGIICYKGECGETGACETANTSCDAMCTAAGKTCANECGGGTGNPPPLVGGLGFTVAACGGAEYNLTCTTSLTHYTSVYCCCF